MSSFPVYIEVEPAYGRDYTSAKAAKADWHAGVDFFIPATQRYVSVRDAQRDPDLRVIIRYAKSRKVTGV
jgi:hypothetical protein